MIDLVKKNFLEFDRSFDLGLFDRLTDVFLTHGKARHGTGLLKRLI